MTKYIAIRIRGTVDVPGDVKDTLNLLRLRRKFAAVILEKNQINLGMLHKAKDYITYGEIDPDTLKQLLLKRAKREGEKPLEIAGKAIDDFMQKFLDNKAKLSDIKVKPFFRLHPPRGGFKKSTRLSAPKGLLGYQGQKINALVQKMF
jgi:large subunit ribosomal protein L30